MSRFKDQDGGNARRIGYWATTGLAALGFVVPGLQNLLHTEHVLRDMTALGYPVYFMTILGTWKILGGVTILMPRLPRLKEWAYAGMFFDLTGASISRAVTDNPAAMVIAPLLVAGLVVASWWLRPEERRLPSPQTHSLRPVSSTATAAGTT